MNPDSSVKRPALDGKKRRGKRDVMEFAYSGPFAARSLDGRVGRSFSTPVRDLSGRIITPEPRYSCSAQNYTIGAAIGPDTARALEARFGRQRGSAPGRRKHRTRTEAKA